MRALNMTLKEKSSYALKIWLVSALIMNCFLPMVWHSIAAFIFSYIIVLFGPIYHILDGQIFDEYRIFLYAVLLLCPLALMFFSKLYEPKLFSVGIPVIVWNICGALCMFLLIVGSV